MICLRARADWPPTFQCSAEDDPAIRQFSRAAKKIEKMNCRYIEIRVIKRRRRSELTVNSTIINNCNFKLKKN